MEGILPNIPRIYTALAEWSACMFYILLYRRRLHGIKFGLTAGGALCLLTVFLTLTGSVPVNFWLLCMAFAVGFMYLLFLLCSEMSVIASGYCTVRAFILAELAASLEWQIYLAVFYKHGFEENWISVVCLCVVYIVFSSSCIGLKMDSKIEEITFLLI